MEYKWNAKGGGLRRVLCVRLSHGAGMPMSRRITSYQFSEAICIASCGVAGAVYSETRLLEPASIGVVVLHVWDAHKVIWEVLPPLGQWSPKANSTRRV